MPGDHVMSPLYATQRQIIILECICSSDTTGIRISMVKWDGVDLGITISNDLSPRLYINDMLINVQMPFIVVLCLKMCVCAFIVYARP